MTTQGDTGVAQPGGGIPEFDNGVTEPEAEVSHEPATPPQADAGDSSQDSERPAVNVRHRPAADAAPATPDPESSGGEATPDEAESEADPADAPSAEAESPEPEAEPDEAEAEPAEPEAAEPEAEPTEAEAEPEAEPAEAEAEPEAAAEAEPEPPALPMPEIPIEPLAGSLRRLRDALAATRFGLALPVAEQAERHTRTLVAQLDDYVLPRLARLDAPLLVVVGGSTGAGKSTLVNSLLRAPVSPAGVLRPTTRSPVLVCHPDDVRWFGETHLLPGLPRGRAIVDGPRETTPEDGRQRVVSRDPQGARLQIVTAPGLTTGVAFLDAPDIDSIVDTNRELAGQLLAAADLWLFLTTAARYADAVPWDVLRDAQERGAAVALVLDRVPDPARDVVVAHLRQMLVDHSFGGSPLFTVAEQALDHEGLLPEEATAPIREWFASLAGDAEHRAAVVRQTLSGTVASLHPRVDAIAVQADAQRDAAAGLRVTAQNAYAEALTRVEQGLADGALLRGEVLARWQELIGSGDLTRALDARVGRWRDQMKAVITGRPLPGGEFTAALGSGTATLITAVAADAAEQTAAQWATHPAGRALLERTADDRLRYYRPSPDLPERAQQLVTDWQRGVLELVRAEARRKRSVARITAYPVNATGLRVMIAVFASTAFIPTGAENAVAGGTTIAGQKILEAIFGDHAVRRLAARAKQNLLDRVRVLLDDERQRYTDLLHEAGVDPAASDRLRTASGEVERDRVAAGLIPSRDALTAIRIRLAEPDPAEGAAGVPGESKGERGPEPTAHREVAEQTKAGDGQVKKPARSSRRRRTTKRSSA